MFDNINNIILYILIMNDKQLKTFAKILTYGFLQLKKEMKREKREQKQAATISRAIEVEVEEE